jgi:ribosome recycling factor
MKKDNRVKMSAFDTADITKRMDGALQALKKEFGGLRTSRADARLLEPVMVDIYGSKMPIHQVATITVADARLITVTVWDSSQTKMVDKAIRESGLGLNPMSEGTLIRVPLPDLSAERRTELVKVAHKYSEQARVAIRHVRRDGMDAIKKLQKDAIISEDEHNKLTKEIQLITDKHIKQVDDALAAKEKDIGQI